MPESLAKLCINNINGSLLGFFLFCQEILELMLISWPFLDQAQTFDLIEATEFGMAMRMQRARNDANNARICAILPTGGLYKKNAEFQLVRIY